MARREERKRHTQRLDIILIEAPLDVLDHQARLSDLRVPHHAYFDDDAAGHLVSPNTSMRCRAYLFFSSLLVSRGCVPLDGPAAGVGVDDEEALEDMDELNY
jgi:hypothetical protein